MLDNTERRKSIISTAAKAAGLYGSEAAAERVLRKKALRALDVVAKSVKQDFLSPSEIEEKLGLKVVIGECERVIK